MNEGTTGPLIRVRSNPHGLLRCGWSTTGGGIHFAMVQANTLEEALRHGRESANVALPGYCFVIEGLTIGRYVVRGVKG